ncbi:MAG: LacI family DNA-binding transcriptional regulator, partial [Candidatus Omnitrophica bacterium]|nr:LacI family DNA-binding transcriptional regulator [Candidatus Omnitrophota bacterium]
MSRNKKTPSRNISIVDVAKTSGVSIATVSRVINKIGTVKESNRIKVNNTIKNLKFQPSVFAQRLATG